jgi:hypothetical protein
VWRRRSEEKCGGGVWRRRASLHVCDTIEGLILAYYE